MLMKWPHKLNNKRLLLRRDWLRLLRNNNKHLRLKWLLKKLKDKENRRKRKKKLLDSKKNRKLLKQLLLLPRNWLKKKRRKEKLLSLLLIDNSLRTKRPPLPRKLDLPRRHMRKR